MILAWASPFSIGGHAFRFYRKNDNLLIIS